MNWHFKLIPKKIPKLKNPVLIEGLPGIGNVGKIAVDFIVDSKKGKKIYDVFSYYFPHSVFVNEKNLVELPKIEIYHVKAKKRDILILAGDVQPADEKSCYQFCDSLLDLMKKLNCSEIITLGGIGLQKIPKEPKIFVTGVEKSVVDNFASKHDVNKNLYGIVGPVIGVTGVLTGLSGRRGLRCVSLLAETYGHPMFLGVNGAREMLKVLDKEFKIGLDLKKLDKEIRELELDMVKKANELSEVSKKSAIKKLSGKLKDEELNYIG
jgi:uncharacterized protein (TIGR00162 family)